MVDEPAAETPAQNGEPNNQKFLWLAGTLAAAMIFLALFLGFFFPQARP